MRIQRRSIKKARIEIIPMIDTIFFLLVFFMISTLSMTQFKGMPVNLPKAASGQQAPAESAAITIDKDGELFLNQQASDKVALGEALRQRLAKNAEMLVCRADDGVQQSSAGSHGYRPRRQRGKMCGQPRSRKNERALAGLLIYRVVVDSFGTDSCGGAGAARQTDQSG
jgi:biopolymer transport protein ExbD